MHGLPAISPTQAQDRDASYDTNAGSKDSTQMHGHCLTGWLFSVKGLMLMSFPISFKAGSLRRMMLRMGEENLRRAERCDRCTAGGQRANDVDGTIGTRPHSGKLGLSPIIFYHDSCPHILAWVCDWEKKQEAESQEDLFEATCIQGEIWAFGF